jgi:hypothetical protein
MEHQELREEISRIARQMSASGLVPTTSGNVSARTPEGNVLITPSGLDYDVLARLATSRYWTEAAGRAALIRRLLHQLVHQPTRNNAEHWKPLLARKRLR